jgi:hypothetical protein
MAQQPKQPLVRELAIEVSHGDGKAVAKTPGVVLVNHERADGRPFSLTVTTN